ncbi:hypothetical protein BU25DRAFT_461708 [Macroventuria anomochaeta]|uniref:Uncharacterized protein n=1 Tax=Macroventuria anomochaeta TaxID=301207 RepID=A0ACB6RPF5_9PLEO|nr:uncharacterized protein BU25DRAFT_461708 [Macroventuria anomochaeta]KAF2623931.1 hypothetical protein BU25DRAFT_461708 [Macroventuria anomochaeta]
MGWITRYGKWQDDFAPPAPRPIRFKHIVAGLIFLALLGACIAFFSLTVIFVPKPQLTEYMPKGVFCATCEEIWYHNRNLFDREDMLCYGPPTHDRMTRIKEEVMFSEEKRCWALKKGHDEWMRPLQVTDEETKKWERRAQTIVLRGGHWP